ncbi:putative gtp-binding protein [Daldinia childiae]|uniref:putative gtp-binding protein n=1 Tax=Daldinia childiae TaxID=326645 RepID=UPI0014472044|nr:putative gtp-binding protein [Daldinia childiae]KAF3070494.1 putative gtp-binding protein [Daldinia childiae]
MPLRTKNRRASTGKFYGNQKMELSFVITRCDLLAPTKVQVDRMFPWLQEVLREALGRTGRNVRLGNLIALSAKRSWWTRELKEDVWKRGGAGWMVGKANVGKSQLFEAIFPKGRMNLPPSKHQITVEMQARTSSKDATSMEKAETKPELAQEDLAVQEMEDMEEEELDEYALLPPAVKETNYPEMPLVSDLPGTTASPIRIPFGNGRGELIDLPGLERTGLEKYVKEEHRLSLIMRSRVIPEQMTLTPSRSLLLGGFIRITPREPAPIMLAYAFTPIEAHVSRTEKAIGIQNQTGEVNVENIAVPGTGEKTKLAGSFELKWDVTTKRTGPLMRKEAVGLTIDRLPYRVLSTDILIEGVGWVEITAQVRTKDLFKERPVSDTPPVEKSEEKKELSALERLEALVEDPKKKAPRPPPVEEQGEDDEPNWPIVDVYTPEGKFISSRRPMNGWVLNKPKVTAASRRSRPRRSMKGQKKLEKHRKREREGTATSSF